MAFLMTTTAPGCIQTDSAALSKKIGGFLGVTRQSPGDRQKRGGQKAEISSSWKPEGTEKAYFNKANQAQNWVSTEYKKEKKKIWAKTVFCCLIYGWGKRWFLNQRQKTQYIYRS